MAAPRLTREPYGKTLDGTPVELFTLRNPEGAVVRILTFGAIAASVEMLLHLPGVTSDKPSG